MIFYRIFMTIVCIGLGILTSVNMLVNFNHSISEPIFIILFIINISLYLLILTVSVKPVRILEINGIRQMVGGAYIGDSPVLNGIKHIIKLIKNHKFLKRQDSH